jgi:uncharacterized protein (TIGR00369 family)
LFEKTFFELVEATPERTVYRYRVRPEHLNAIGVLHGGMIAALLDTAMGVVVARNVRPKGSFNTAATLNVSFYAGVRDGEIVGTARVLRLGKRMAFTEATATQGDTTIAHATACFAVLPLKPAAPA